MSDAISLLVELTAKLKTAIDCADWSQASDIECARRNAAEACFAGSPPDPEHVEILQAIDRETIILLDKVRIGSGTVAREASALRNGRRAVDNYTDVLIRSLG